MSKASKDATHYTTIGTRKYQCNGPTEWSATFKELAKEIGGANTPEGVGIRAILAAGVAAVKSKSGQGQAVKLATALESTLSELRSDAAVKTAAAAAKEAKAKAKAKAKATKAPKAPKAGDKGPAKAVA